MLFRHPWPGVASVGGEPANFPRAGVVCIVRSGCWQLQISQCLYLPKYTIDDRYTNYPLIFGDNYHDDDNSKAFQKTIGGEI